MKMLSSGSHNIAWFKLAEFVSRGEKERALSVYKLLMHSVADQAFAHQLEGDILLAFDDASAVDRYHRAADVYKKQKDYQKAIAVYEHVASCKNDLKNLQALLEIYDYLQDDRGLVNSFARFANLAVATKNIGLLINQLHAYAAKTTISVQAELYAYTCLALLAHDPLNFSIKTYLQQTIELYCAVDNPHALDKFMAKLKVLHESFYEFSQEILLKN
jgi:tetratricopeptide (TPR) repeat protein